MIHSGSLGRRTFLATLASIPLVERVVAEGQTQNSVSISETQSDVTISNGIISVTIGREYGGIQQVTAVESGLLLCDPDVEREPRHWRLTFYSDDYEELRSDSYNARSPAIEVIEGDDTAEVRVEWSDIELVSPYHSGALGMFDGTVECRVIVEAGSPEVRWELNAQNVGELAIRSASCPYINGIGSLDPDGDDELVLPQLIGKRIRNPTRSGPDGISYPSGFGTMQFTSYTNRSRGFYTQTQDLNGFTKELSWESGREGTLRYRMRHFVPRRAGEGVSIPYPSTLGVIDGDWHAVADRYREWLLNKGWLSDVDAGLPEWIHRSGAFFQLTSYTRSNYPDPLQELSYQEIVDRMRDLVEYLDAPLELRWRGWQTHGRSHGLDWYPPMEGRDAFRQAITDLSSLDVRALSFISGSFGFEFADFWQENRNRAEDWVIRAKDGSMKEMDYFPDHPEDNILYLIEFPHDDYQAEIRRRLKKFADLGGDGVNLDGFPWNWVPECYTSHHDHQAGFGGNWFARDSRRALRNLVQTARSENPRFMLSGEGLSDFYLPYLQVAYYRAAAPERHLEVPESENVDLVPVLPYTLGEFHAIRAATIFLDKEDYEYQNLAVARAFVWGCIPAVNMDYPVDISGRDLPTLDFLGRTARARSEYANRFIARGSMLRQPELNVGTVRMETLTVSPGEDTMTVWSPEVLSSAWRSAAGETGFVFTMVNPQKESQPVEFDLTAQPTWLPERPWLVYIVKNGDYERVGGDVDETGLLRIDLQQWDVAVIVVTPSTEAKERALDALIDAQRAVGDISTQPIEQAKRRFEAHDFTGAIDITREVIDTDNTPTAMIESGTTPSPTNVKMESDSSVPGANQTTTSADAPGFNVLVGLAGVVAAIAAKLRGSN